MSIWTHVAGVIRIDDFRMNSQHPNFDSLIGKECLWDSNGSVWEDQEKLPENYLPMGSEGSLQKSVWVNPKTNSLAAYTVTIFGDLRDYSNPDGIIEWFKNKCKEINKKYIIRQATITAETEFIKTVNWTYEEDEDE